MAQRLSQPEDRAGDARAAMMKLLRSEVSDERVLAAFESVPRERFITGALAGRAYDDSALPIGEGQTISQPLMVALMIAALDVRSDHRVLEVGTGSGYAAAVLSRLAGQVVTVERRASFVEAARERLAALGCGNVRVFAAGANLGRVEDGPYDRVLVSAAAPHVPRALLDQTAPGGRMIIPVGALKSQELLRIRKRAHGLELARLMPCSFVPLLGVGAWNMADTNWSDGANVGG